MTESGFFNVYDLFYPSPPSLEELASIQIALDLWRHEINRYRLDDTLDDLDLKSSLPVSSILSNMPPAILRSIENFSKKVGPSIESWLKYHIDKRILKFEVLKNFSDFSCDFDGTIHYKWTAKRLLACDEVSDGVKFRIAGWNCFKDEIWEIWPSVSESIDGNIFYLDAYFDDMHTRFQLYYWHHRLMQKWIVYPRGDLDYMDTKLLGNTYWPALEYALNLIYWPYELLVKIKDLARSSQCSVYIRCRYVLPKLDEFETQDLLCEDEMGCSLITSMLDEKIEINFIMCTWSRIKNWLSKEDFIALVQSVIKKQIYSIGEYPTSSEYATAWREIWKSAPDHLKQSVMSYINVYGFLCVGGSRIGGHLSQMSCLLVVLSDASIEDRRIFWNRNWRQLIINKELNELRHLVDLCFSNETDFEQFKTDVMAGNFEIIRYFCTNLLHRGWFEYLNEYLVFYCPDEQSVKDIKVRLLNEYGFGTALIEESKSFNQFIDDAYSPDVDLANAYKTKVFSRRPVPVSNAVNRCLSLGQFQPLMQFIDTFSATKQKAEEYKKSEIVPLVRSFFINVFFPKLDKTAGDDLSMFMSWLLGSEDEAAQFKQALPVDDIVQNELRNQISSRNKIKIDHLGRRVRPSPYYSHFLTKFLEWYFVTDEAVEEFKAKYTEELMRKRWKTRSR